MRLYITFIYFFERGEAMPGLTASRQDYLEAIYDLSLTNKNVRSIDIASALGFSRASISRAISILKKDGYIIQEPYGTITLTELGLREAQSVRKRHDLLKYYLIHILEIPEAIAEADACKMEHVVSENLLNKMEEVSAEHIKKYHSD